VTDSDNRLQHLRKAWDDTNNAKSASFERIRQLELTLRNLKEQFGGDSTKAKRNESTAPGILSRVRQVIGGSYSSHQGPTQTHREQFAIASAEFSHFLKELRILVQTDLPALERELESAGAPHTPARFPDWR
jgi:hypothetical protein